jgi:hypothetical protein
MDMMYPFEQIDMYVKKNRLYQQLKKYETSIKLIATNQVEEPLLIVSGIPGIGKSYLLRTICRDLHKSLSIIAPPNAPAMVQALWDNRHVDVLGFDDYQSILTAPFVIQVLKDAFGPDREVRWHAKSSGQKGNAPRHFKVSCKALWISNYDLSDSLIAVKPAARESVKGLLSRSGQTLDIGATPVEVYQYSIWLATHGDMWKAAGESIGREAMENALDWFTHHRDHLKELSPRTLFQAGRNFYKGKGNTKEILEYLDKQLSDHPLRDIPGFGKLKLIKHDQWKEEWEHPEFQEAAKLRQWPPAPSQFIQRRFPNDIR